ncbi:DNA polymerase IV [Streptomyces fumanus]
MLAKIASEEAKPDGLVLIEPGTERALLAPMPVRTLPGVGPATGDHLRRAGITTVGELAEAGEDELVRLLGKAHGHALYAMALARDERPVVAEREAKSASVEDTYDVDIHDRVRVGLEVRRLADRCVRRLRQAGLSGRTIVLKVRRYDFSTLTRSETLRGPTDYLAVVGEAAARLLDSVDTTGGVRLLGVGVSGLADYTQEDLFAQAAGERAAADAAEAVAEGAEQGAGDAVGGARAEAEPPPAERRWPSGHDVRHAEYGHWWVQGSGLGRVTVRFETPGSPPGRVRTFRVDDPELAPAEPLPLVERRPGGGAGTGRDGRADGFGGRGRGNGGLDLTEGETGIPVWRGVRRGARGVRRGAGGSGRVLLGRQGVGGAGREAGWGGDVEAVVVVELELLLRQRWRPTPKSGASLIRARSKGTRRAPSTSSLGSSGTNASRLNSPVRIAAHSGTPVASSR